ncbi:MAG: CDGSH iron-sulfur domain-containing protein [Alphaproteobacteria bacterium]|nr:CDGSH iron-sulfur domain-containing protein [Alphaproteobacteria bacterium]MBV9693582.1 CDGSH iron-sulfur domain-containing protein [Alphaproteobacteria bacterium]
MAAPETPRTKGYYFEVQAGRRYFWCACGRSATQPFCDGSHAGTEFQPVLFVAEKDEDVIFCGCKRTATRPFCDGAHNNLPGAYHEDDPDSDANRAVGEISHGAEPEVRLDGECYVFATSRAKLEPHGNFSWCRIAGPDTGARYQSQFYAEIGEGISPVVSARDRHVILFVTQGEGQVEIAGRRFDFAARTGAYVKPGEAFRLHARTPTKLYISTGPALEALSFPDAMAHNFDGAHPERLAEIDPAQRHAMAERYFQMLVSKPHGSSLITQFIGNIPRSKAEPHKHLYEEALIFLNGAGMVWTERTKTRVGPGDVLFLPRKQTHSVQCLVDGGFDVVGVICPGDNPSINY